MSITEFNALMRRKNAKYPNRHSTVTFNGNTYETYSKVDMIAKAILSQINERNSEVIK